MSRAGLRYQREAQGRGLLASVLNLTLLIFVEILCSASFPIGCVLFEQVVDNFGQFVGRGGRGFGRPEFTPHTAKKGPEITGAGTETLRRHAQSATGAILDPSAPRGEYFAATDLIIRTEA